MGGRNGEEQGTRPGDRNDSDRDSGCRDRDHARLAGRAWSGQRPDRPASGASGPRPAPAAAAGIRTYSTLTGITPGNVHQLAGTWLDQLEGATTNRAQESTPGRRRRPALRADLARATCSRSTARPARSPGSTSPASPAPSAASRSPTAGCSRRSAANMWSRWTSRPAPGSGSPRSARPARTPSANGSSTPWTMFADGLVFVGTENGGASGMRGHLYALTGVPAASPGRSPARPAQASPATAPGPATRGCSAAATCGWRPRSTPSWGCSTSPWPTRSRGSWARSGPAPTCTRTPSSRCDAGSGKIAWNFQSIRHDLWDYDNTMTPVIASVTYEQPGPGPSSIYGSKSAWLYYLDAKTGKPAIPVHDENGAATRLAGDVRTQPIPAGQSLVPTCPRKTGVTQPIPDYAHRLRVHARTCTPRCWSRPAARAARTGRRCRSTRRPACSTSRPPRWTSPTATASRTVSRRSTSRKASSAGACSTR